MNVVQKTCYIIYIYFALSPFQRHYKIDVDLPFRLLPDSIDRMRCLRARVIRSLFHLYEPFSLRVSKIPALPESTPTTLLNSKVNEHVLSVTCNVRAYFLFHFCY